MEEADDVHNPPPTWTYADAMVSFPARLTCYAAIAFVLFQALFLGVGYVGPQFIGSENGPVETAQVYLAILAAACLLYAAYHCRRGRAGLITCATMVAYAAARESDSMIEAMLFHDAYQWVIGLPLFLIAITALIIDRRRVVPDAMWLVRQPAVTLFALGGIYLCTACQMLDRPDLWIGISEIAEADSTKAMIEEFAELFAYLTIAFGGIEALAMAHGLDVVAVPQADTPTSRTAVIDHAPLTRKIAA
ncbi:MAG: hypothetical protein HKN47_06625 [Pirellulaceae bacterium]|nr:hypothetical protein [Pirellulaceae bacterium]